MYDIYAQLAYALKGSDVETVVIGGRVVMRDRKLLTVNEEAAMAKAREYKKSIAMSLGMPDVGHFRATSSARLRVPWLPAAYCGCAAC